MKCKWQVTCILTALAMLCPAYSAAARLADEQAQLSVIMANRELWDWSNFVNQGLIVGFAAADIDCNGKMELIAAFTNPETKESGGYVWEVADDNSGLERRGETWTREQTYGDWLNQQTPACYVGDGKYWYVFDKQNWDEEGNLTGRSEYALALYDDPEWGKTLHVQFLGNESYNYDDAGNQHISYEDGNGAYLTAEQYAHERLGVRHFQGFAPKQAKFSFLTYDKDNVQKWQNLTDAERTKKLRQTFRAFRVSSYSS